MLKKLFCKHDYKYFNGFDESRVFRTGSQCLFEFVCKNCGKNITLKQDKIIERLNSADRYINRMKVLGKPHQFNSCKITIKTAYGLHAYEGDYVDMVLQKYKKRGIDLLDIHVE